MGADNLSKSLAWAIDMLHWCLKLKRSTRELVMRTGMLITLVLFSVGCSENDLGDLKDISNPSDMDIEVSPAALDFGILSHEDPAVLRTFT